MTAPTVHALPCGVDFPRELVNGLIAKMADHPPEAMARVHLYLNAGRMMRRVREEFDRHGARYLPRLKLVTDLGRAPLPGLPPAIPSLRRKLELAQLVAGLVDRLPGFEAGHGRFGLAESLATLMAEMQSEGVPPDALEALDIADTHAQHWRLSLDFIRIVARYFEPDATPDSEARQRRVVQHILDTWAMSPPSDPIIVAGSTGSRGATALFMEHVARLPNGTVVLPGYDFEMPDLAWSSLKSGSFPIEDHPQYRYRAFLDRLDVPPNQVQNWSITPPASPARNAMISLALRPAPVTDQWMSEGQSLPDLAECTRDITLIEAPDPRHEAVALALVLREAAEQGRTAALISPDRLLTRRVAVALDRWGITPDDSAGQPLQQTAPGRLIRHVAAMMGQRIALDGVLILLKHPLTATGSTLRGTHLRYTRELELRLRRYGPAFPDRDALMKWAKEDDDKIRWAEWVWAVLTALAAAQGGPLTQICTAHLAITADLAAGPGGDIDASELWLEEGGREARRIFAELLRESDTAGDYSRSDYADLVHHLLQGGMARAGLAAHPNIAIWGTLEARTQGADLVILAGLNEGSWPEAPAPDPWLSRAMRLEAGLLLPERQIGLSAHDFQQAVAAPQVILSRARRDAEAETVPSRWINRLMNLLSGLTAQDGPQALKAMVDRGNRWVDMAQSLDAPRQDVAPMRRPSPRPPVEKRPKELSVTAIRTLIRDPYAIYAKRILRLNPLNPLSPEPDPLLRGTVLHKIVETFTERPISDDTPEQAHDRLLRVAEEVLQKTVPWPSAQRLWLARIARIAKRFVADEIHRAENGTPVVVENQRSVTLQNPIFTLTAKPDRIDLLHDGRARIYDYKSGTPPTAAQVISYDKQLLLEAAMVERGAFEVLGPREVAGMSYIQLGAAGATTDFGSKIITRKHGNTPAREESVAESWAKFEMLIAQYFDPKQGYTAQRAMELQSHASDYGHLSRFGEWELSDEAVPEDLT
ncbi:double-strand break repair protein AddB [Thioclava sp. SK-1]|uniref:double-strand break repair protein AddB n=1 Tax=Thioclava sp. SK-1 TaxID=1889770 RepID=UPI000824EE86|nr:double-strand break repair protein AddB [Thioclava sp. SK-1]OCX61576.1 double-strand break repair protein AddB [Thioclava sp. SK-1]